MPCSAFDTTTGAVLPEKEADSAPPTELGIDSTPPAVLSVICVVRCLLVSSAGCSPSTSFRFCLADLVLSPLPKDAPAFKSKSAMNLHNCGG